MKVSAISCASPFFEEIIGFYRVLYPWYLSFNVVRRIFAASRDEVVDSLADRSVPAGALDGLGLS